MKTLVVFASLFSTSVALADAVSSASYVQDGLVSQWDAIDNAGSGSHAADAATWKDLAGASDLAVDLTKCVWTANALAADGAQGFAVAAAAISDYKTVEICYRPSAAEDPHCIFACGSSERFTWSVTNAVPTPGALVRVAATYGETESTSPASVYLNGAVNTDVVAESWGTQPSVFSVGWGLPLDRDFSGSVCAIRLYSRALTASEIEANAAVDLARFGVANGATTDEKGRLVLAAETDSTYEHTAAIGAVPGLRKVGGGEAVVTNRPGALRGSLAVEEGTLATKWADAIGAPTSVVVAAGATLNYGAGVSSLAADVSGAGTIRFAGTSANRITSLGAVTYGRTDSTLCGYYAFEDAANVGRNSAPTSGNDLSVDGAGDPAITLVDGVVGKGVHIREENNKTSPAFLLVSSATTTLPSGTDDFTISFWMRMDSSTTQQPRYAMRYSGPLDGSVAEGRTNTGWSRGWWFTLMPDNTMFIGPLSGWVSPSTATAVAKATGCAYSNGQWHHVVGTREGKEWKLYFDGALKASYTHGSVASLGTDARLQVGNYNTHTSQYNYNGDYDEVQFCKGAWSAETVAAEYEAKKAPIASIAPAAFTGLWQTYAANVAFGSAGVPSPLNAASSLEIANGGYFRFFCNQTVASLFGDGIDGGVDIAAGTTFTVSNATDAAFAGRLAGGGDFVKDGAGTLTLSGASSATGTVEVKKGTLALKGHAGYARDDSDLCGYWAFEDETNVGANSSTFPDNDVAVDAYGSPTVALVDGVVGEAIRLVEPNSQTSPTYLLTGSAACNLPHGTDDFTISFWMRMPSTTSQTARYAMRYSGTLTGSVAEGFNPTGWNGGWWFTLMSSNRMFFGPLHTGGWISPSAASAVAWSTAVNYSDGNWHHVVGTREGTVWKLYVDGTLTGTYEHTTVTSLPSDARMQIGNYNCHDQPNYSYNGDYDEIQFCRGAWSAATVASEYAAKRRPLKRAQSVLPDPVAHWTFDAAETVEGVSVFKDSGPLGLHFKNVASGGKSVVSRPHTDGTPGGSAYFQYSGAYLTLLPSVTNACQTRLLGGKGAPDFTLSVRLANFTRTEMTRNSAVNFGNPGGAQTCVRISYEGYYINGDSGEDTCDAAQPRCIRILAGGDNSTKGYALSDTYSMTSAADPMWTTLTLTFAGRTMKIYRDGTYITTRTATNLSLDLKIIDLGHTPWGTTYGYAFDDMRVYDCTLSDEQVKTLVRSQALGVESGDVPVLPETTEMTVDAGATLALDGAIQPLAALAGAGSVSLANANSELAVGDLTEFAGAFAGEGRLALANGARYAKTLAVDATVADGALKLALAQKNVPLVKTTGAFILPATGTLTLTDAASAGAWAGEVFQLAECASYAGPADTTGWTFTPAGTEDEPLKGRFIFRDGKLSLKMSGGMVLIVR